METNAGGGARDHDRRMGERGQSEARRHMAREDALRERVPHDAQQAHAPVAPRQGQHPAHNLPSDCSPPTISSASHLPPRTSCLMHPRTLLASTADCNAPFHGTPPRSPRPRHRRRPLVPLSECTDPKQRTQTLQTWEEFLTLR